MKKVKNVLIVLWTIFSVLSPAILGEYNADNILFAALMEIFGVLVIGIFFGILQFISKKVSPSQHTETDENIPVEQPVRKITLRVVSGAESFRLNEKRSVFTVKQWKDGYVTVSNDPTKFEMFDYEWNGPEYKNISKTTSTSTTKGKKKEKTGRKGRLTGAVVGTAATVATLGNPVIGAAVGAAVGTGKKTKGKNISTTTGNSTTVNSDMEIDSFASVKFRNIETNQVNTVGFYCTSRTDIELKSFNIANTSDFNAGITSQKNSVELLKEYKNLFDAGIITKEEFEQKKAELL